MPRLSEAQRFLVLSLFIGLFSGILVVLFHISIDSTSWSALGAFSGRFRYGRLASPAIGAVLAVFIVRRDFPRGRGSGVNQTKMAIYTSDGYVSSSTIVGKFLACAISIGTVIRSDPEDPSLQMGAGVASRLGRLFHLSRANMRLIAPVGQPPASPRRSTRPSQAFCLSWKRCWPIGAPPLWSRSFLRLFRRSSRPVLSLGTSRCFAFPNSNWPVLQNCWSTRASASSVARFRRSSFG